MPTSFQEKILPLVKENLLIIALFSGGLILLGIGVIQMTGQKQAKIRFESGTKVEGSPVTKIKVDVEGEVIKPGVYELSSDARVQDALISAGGLTSNANRNTINLAAKLADGQKIYVPAQGEAVMTSTTGIKGITGLVSINSGTQAELEELPGIGPVTAGKIIDNRPYGSVQELLERKIVGKTTFEKIKDLITL